MRQLTGIVYTILLAVTSGWAQQNGIEVKLAEKLGLCTAQKGQPSNYSMAYPCNQCKFKFLSLSPGGEPDLLFFLETQSPNHCGSGGCTGTVYRKRGNGYDEVNNFLGYFEKSIPQSGHSVPDLIYIHVEYPQHDFDNDGSWDPATLRVRYRWNSGRQSFEIIDILSIEAYEKQIPVTAWRKRLLEEFRQKSPWMY
ncbi:MAG: hypothetical protein KDD02_10045 [Phaeodactylibacter sp.]|nr:hypothetical protein [Phaeodactylibacter sp.]MCB9303763.1 hypothetical protein [Lewinellaceae bacterium]